MPLRYKILRDLGKGAMGEVVLAIDTNLDRKVALKFLSAHVQSDREYVDRIMREARISADLNHSNIVHVYDFGEFTDSVEDGPYDGRIYISMEYVEGQTLKTFLKESYRLSNKLILDISRQIAEALAYAHKRNTFHRDIKPENILLTTEDQIKLLDFGLAKSGNVSTLTNDQILGTPYYMSPEQAEGEQDIDYRTDIFSFGIVLYELTTHERPFQGDSFEVVKHAIQNKQPAPVAQFNKDAPKGLQRIIEKCLAKARGDRYQSATEIIKALKREERIIEPYGGMTARMDDASPKEWKESIVNEAKTLRKQKEEEEVNRLLVSGLKQYNKGKYEAAVDRFKGVIAIQPENPEANEYLVKIRKSLEHNEILEKLLVDADFYFKKKKYSEASELFERALKIDSQNKTARKGLARTEKRLHGGSMSLPWLVPRLLVVILGLAIAWFVADRFGQDEASVPAGPAEEIALTDEPTDVEESVPAPVAEDNSEVRAQKDLALKARQRTVEQKEAAIGAEAHEFAAALFDAAQRQEQQGNLKLDSDEIGQLREAEKDFDEAADKFLDAIAEAELQQKKVRDNAAAAGQSARAEKERMLSQKARVPSEGRSSNEAYTSGESFELDGDAQFQRGDFRAARLSYRQARDRYGTAADQIRSAINAARAGQAKRREAERQQAADAAREVFTNNISGTGVSDWQADPEFADVKNLVSEAEAAYQGESFEQAETGYKKATAAIADILATRATLRQETIQTREQDEEAIRSLIDDFKESIEQGNFPALKKVVPLSKQEDETWVQLFGIARDTSVKLENTVIDVDGNTATVNIHGVIHYHNSSNNSKGQINLNLRWVLNKAANGWSVISK